MKGRNETVLVLKNNIESWSSVLEILMHKELFDRILFIGTLNIESARIITSLNKWLGSAGLSEIEPTSLGHVQIQLAKKSVVSLKGIESIMQLVEHAKASKLIVTPSILKFYRVNAVETGPYQLLASIEDSKENIETVLKLIHEAQTNGNLPHAEVS